MVASEPAKVADDSGKVTDEPGKVVDGLKKLSLREENYSSPS